MFSTGRDYGNGKMDVDAVLISFVFKNGSTS
jgi:hypothetical protein